MPSKGSDPTTYLLKRQNQLLASQVLNLRVKNQRSQKRCANASAHAARLRVLVDAMAVFARNVLVRVASTVQGNASSDDLTSAFDAALQNVESMAAVQPNAGAVTDGGQFQGAVQAALQDWHGMLFGSKVVSMAQAGSSGKEVRPVRASSFP